MRKERRLAGERMKPVALTMAALVTFAAHHAYAQQEDVDKVHVRIAKKVAPAVVAVDGGGLRGSGVIIDKSGILLTSSTAVGTATTRVNVTTKGSRTYSGKVMGRANDRELVVVEIGRASCRERV